MKYPLLAILVVLLLAALGFFYRQKIISLYEPSSASKAPINRERAWEYVEAWAKTVRKDARTLQRDPNGDFYGKIGAATFEYIDRDKILIARGTVIPQIPRLENLPNLEDDPILWYELRNVEKNDPDSIVGGRFEIFTGKWDSGNPPSLYIRLDFTDESRSSFINKVDKLTEAAYIWHRTKFREVAAKIREQNGTSND